MLYECIWESSFTSFFSQCTRRSQANTHQGKTFWKSLAMHSRTRSNAFILLFMLFYRVHYYAPLQHIAAKRRMWRCNSISRLLKWPIDIQNSDLFHIHHIYRWICGIQMFPLPKGKCDLVQQLCMTSCMTQCWRNIEINKVNDYGTGDVPYNNTIQLD